VDEAFRMLGREHQADLEREAQKRRLGAVARSARVAGESARRSRQRRRFPFFLRVPTNA
jgi:hypothetical protein